MRIAICPTTAPCSPRRKEGDSDAPPRHLGGYKRKCGFTLLEVIIACAIFFIAGFAILELVTRSVSMARSLQQREPDAGMIAASLSLTNQLIEGSETGDFQDLCGDLYRDYSWGRDIYEVGSNGLFQVDFFVINDKRAGAEPVKMSILLYRPQSPPGSATRPR